MGSGDETESNGPPSTRSALSEERRDWSTLSPLQLPPLPSLPPSSSARPSSTAWAITAGHTSHGAAAVATADLFDPKQCLLSKLPLFTKQHIRQREPAADKTAKEEQELTFTQWLDYYLAHPKYEKQRRYLLSDEQYCLLLGWVTSEMERVIDYVNQHHLDSAAAGWLYHATSDNTYKYSVAEYHGTSVNDMAKGAVLVCFKEPARRKGGKVHRRQPSSTTPLTGGLRRRCIPYSQIELACYEAHTGDLVNGRTLHRGQVAMWDALSAEYDGVNRNISRMYVKKCAVCQQHQQRQHKAALVPITASTLYERVVIDLIDFTRKPSHGFHYIFHAVDHFSKYHWCWAIRDKRPVTVAYYMRTLLRCTGPIKHVQCDQGREFVAELLAAVDEFGCGRVCNSSAFHPQTNGVVERYNGVFKEALEHWFTQENSQDWYVPLDRICYQLNCTKPRTTRYPPFELVHGKKPAPAYRTAQLWPLRPETMAAAQEAAAVREAAIAVLEAAAPRLDSTTVMPADPAVTVLASMASAQAGNTPPASPPGQQLPLPESQLPLQQPQLPAAELELPSSEWQLPVEDSDVYPEQVVDLAPGEPGQLNKATAEELNVGCHFIRLGGEGGGRCAISAFTNALDPMACLNLTSAQRRQCYDKTRQELHTMWQNLELDIRPVSRQKREQLREMIYHIGMGGRDDEAPAAGEQGREEAWAQLGDDLGIATKSLGTEALALMGHHFRVNVLLFICSTQSQQYGAGVPQALERWRAATPEQREQQLQDTGRAGKQPGGKWLENTTGTTFDVVPHFIVADLPWVVLYQRTLTCWKHRQVRSGPERGKVEVDTDPGTGHFEAIVKRTFSASGAVEYTGTYRMGDHTSFEYDRVLLLARRIQAYWSSQEASQRMAVYYDAKHKVHMYELLDAVGVLVPGTNPRKGDTRHSVPGLVIGIKRKTMSAGSKRVVHQMYTVWCPHGVLSQKIKVDRLVSISINSFPELLIFRDETLSAEERLPPDDPNWRSPLRGTARSVPKVTINRAWKKQRGPTRMTQRTVDQSRKRKVNTRAAGDAASVALAAGQADGRSALSLASLTNQPVPHHRSDSPSRIARILSVNAAGTVYTVEWTQPASNPERTRERVGWLHSQQSYVSVVEAWLRQQSEDSSDSSDSSSDEDESSDSDSD